MNHTHGMPHRHGSQLRHVHRHQHQHQHRGFVLSSRLHAVTKPLQCVEPSLIQRSHSRVRCTAHKLRLVAETEEGMEILATLLAQDLHAGDVYCLYGKVGAGKSTFSRAFIRAANEDEYMAVPSPTYLLQNIYEEHEGPPIHHFDLYRLTSGDGGGIAAKDVERVGLNDSFRSAVCLVEWSERLAGLEPSSRCDVHITAVEPQLDKGMRRGVLGTDAPAASGRQPDSDEVQEDQQDAAEFDEYSDQRARCIELEGLGGHWSSRLQLLSSAIQKQDLGDLLKIKGQ